MPFKAELVRDYQPDGTDVILTAGKQFIVVRPDGDGVWADFSRRGAYVLPLDVTNLPLLIEQRKHAFGAQLPPSRQLFFFTNRVTKAGDWEVMLGSEQYAQFDRWILLYGNASSRDTVRAVELASQFMDALSIAERKRTALVYMDTAGDNRKVLEMAKSSQPSIMSMPWYLSKGYAKTFKHLNDTSELPALIELSRSGAVLRADYGLVAVEKAFSADSQ